MQCLAIIHKTTGNQNEGVIIHETGPSPSKVYTVLLSVSSSSFLFCEVSLLGVVTLLELILLLALENRLPSLSPNLNRRPVPPLLAAVSGVVVESLSSSSSMYDVDPAVVAAVVVDRSEAVVPRLRVPSKSSVVPATASVLEFCSNLGRVDRLLCDGDRPEMDPEVARDLRRLLVTMALSEDESGDGNAPG
jgi:hypothetical protein